MKIDYSPRQSGKTTRLIRWIFGGKNRIIITFNHSSAEEIRKEIFKVLVKAYGIKRSGDHFKEIEKDYTRRVVSVRRYMDNEYRSSLKKSARIAVDNAEFVLRELLMHDLTILTISDINKT